MKVITTTISNELWEEAKKYEIKWSEAIRQGISLILSERAEDFNNPLNRERRINMLIEQLTDALKRIKDAQENSKAY